MEITNEYEYDRAFMEFTYYIRRENEDNPLLPQEIERKAELEDAIKNYEKNDQLGK